VLLGPVHRNDIPLSDKDADARNDRIEFNFFEFGTAVPHGRAWHAR
jgi:hypothetical protein